MKHQNIDFWTSKKIILGMISSGILLKLKRFWFKFLDRFGIFGPIFGKIKFLKLILSNN